MAPPEHPTHELILRLPEEHDARAFDAAVRELAQSDPATPFAFGYSADDFAAYVRSVRDGAAGRNLPDGWVPNTFLIALVGDRVVGRISLRHELNDYLRAFGGHVGFAVVPACRRRGYATEMLRRVLPIARDLGIARLLLTCDDDNLGSRTTIERCGGALEDRRPRPDGGVTRRYWIALDA